MTHSNIIAVVLPVYNTTQAPYLSTLARRADDLTTMIWGWQKNPSRMARPAAILKKSQPYLPFLFSPTKQTPKQVTHVGLSGLIVHKSDPDYAEMASWLRARRVEEFAGIPEWNDKVASFYVVTGTRHLGRPIPYEDLILINEDRPLSARKTRGYAIVFLPESLRSWCEEGHRRWDRLSRELPRST